MAAAIRLLRKAQVNVVGIVAVLTEGWDWHGALGQIDPAIPGLVHALGHIPLFSRVEGGWTPIPATVADQRPVSL